MRRLPLLTLLLLPIAAFAQQPDTLQLELDPVVVTAERVATQLTSSTAAVSVIGPTRIRRLPSRHPSGILSWVPGLTFLHTDALGYEPQAVTRGFYGGGEAEYVVLLLNGRPINNVENGLIDWERITAAPGTRVEVLRGGASSLYGDAALGAVINVRTDGIPEGERRVSLRGGGLGLLSATALLSGSSYRLVGDFNDSEGYREHAERESSNLQGTWFLGDAVAPSLALNAGFSRRDVNSPGPRRSIDAGSREQSLAFFRFDGAEEQTVFAGVDGSWAVSPGQLTASLTGRVRDQELTRTLPLSADFADTQLRDLQTTSIRAESQLSGVAIPGGTVVAGAEASWGRLESSYNAVHTGDLSSYAQANGRTGALLSSGEAQRAAVAAYAHADFDPKPGLRVSLGARLDVLSDRFDAVEGLSDAAESASHTALSPKVGMNYRYSSSDEQVGNLYASVSRSFKAPTLDQRYDLRAFPVPFPPFSIRIANPQLVPQTGTSFELGAYHLVRVGEAWSGRLSASAYTMDMTDEIDFSFETFSNVNIGKSRHRGLELGLEAASEGGASAFLNYTLQDVTHRTGEHDGNAVKAIPRHAFSGGLAAGYDRATLGLTVRGHAGVWVDDANTVSLPDFATLDFRLSVASGPADLVVDIYNLLNREYDSTAFPDPAGSDVLFVYPGATRTIAAGVEVSF